ncbi:hypothetical protein BT681P4_00010 [Bacteroides phage BT681P4]|nr:hypothetical protein BT681P4_00010 [Bacteroides phage BT681P4]
MADNVTLLDLSFNTTDAVDGLDKLIAKSLELSDKKAQLTKQIAAEKDALAGVRQNYKDNLIDQTAYEKALAKSASAISGFQKDLDGTNAALKATNGTIKATTTIMNSQAETVETLRAKVAKNTIELNKMSVAERTTGTAGKELVAQTKALSDQLKDLEKGVGDTRRNVGNYAEDIEKATGSMGGLTGATGMMVKGMSGGIASVKAFNAALMANPFIAIASVLLLIIGHLEKLKSRNEELATGLKTLFAPVQFLVTQIADAVAAFLAQLVKGINWLYDAQVKVLDMLGLLPDGFAKAREAIKGVAQAQRDLYNAETDSILVLAKQKKELEQAKLLAADQTKSVEARKAALQDALRISKEMEEVEVGLAEAKYKQIAFENSLSYTMDEQRRQQVEHEAAMEEKRAQYASQRKEIEGQFTGFIKSENDKRDAANKAAATAKAAADKKAAEDAKKAKEAEEKKTAETAKKIQAEVLKSYEQGVTELQLKIRERNIGIIDKRKVIEDQNEINQEILAKERFRLQEGLITQQEFDNTKYEMQVSLQEKIYALEQEEAAQKKEAEAMNAENRRVIAEQNISNEYELRQMQLDAQMAQEIANAEKIGANTALIEQKYNELKRKNAAARYNAELGMAADTAGQMSNLLGQESEAGKIFAVAQATINTYLGASKAIAQGGIWGVAQAAIVIAAGLKQVASIMKVKDDVPKTSTNVRKFAKGGTVFGAPHSQGGVTFTGSNGQQFEAEGGENMYILNKSASRAINALSALNQQYGGRSFGRSNAYKYAQGGGFDVLSTSSFTTINRQMSQNKVDLSDKTINAIAAAFVEGVENAPNPIVSVREINEVSQNMVFIRESAL